jgi:hypothetical protein
MSNERMNSESYGMWEEDAMVEFKLKPLPSEGPGKNKLSQTEYPVSGLRF